MKQKSIWFKKLIHADYGRDFKKEKERKGTKCLIAN